MTIVCVSVTIRPLLNDQLTSLICLSLYPSWLVMTPSLSFCFHLPSEDVSCPPTPPPPTFLQFNGSCIHGWTENVPPLNPGPTFSSWNVFLSLSVSLSLCVVK